MSLRGVATAELVERAIRGDRRATGRLLTLIEVGGEEADEVNELTFARSGGATVVGITGPPGAGKSTLVARLVTAITTGGARPAVLAVDPSSPLSGGAILGDRVRMAAIDATAFIRSVATRGHAGGLALSIPGAIRVLDAAGFDPIVIETVGVGQVEVDITATADTTLVVVTPGMGDAVQANKAGLLEVADVFVVNKADLPGASDARRDLELMLELSHVTGQEDEGYRPPIHMTTATDGDGIDPVVQAITDHHAMLEARDLLHTRREHRARFELATRLDAHLARRIADVLATPELQAVATDIAGGVLSPLAGAEIARRRLGS